MDDAELLFRLFHPTIASLTLFKSHMRKNYYSRYDDDDDDDSLDNEVEINAQEDQAKSKALAF